MTWLSAVIRRIRTVFSTRYARGYSILPWGQYVCGEAWRGWRFSDLFSKPSRAERRRRRR